MKRLIENKINQIHKFYCSKLGNSIGNMFTFLTLVGIFVPLAVIVLLFLFTLTGYVAMFVD